MRKIAKLVFVGVLFAFLIPSCSIFRNNKNDTHVSDIRESVKIDEQLVDTTKTLELTQESLNVKLPERSYKIDVPFLNGEINFINNLYKLALTLDKATNRLTGVFVLPDTLIQGEKTTLRIEEKGVSTKKLEESDKRIKDKEVKVENSVSWKTIGGALIGLIIIIIVLWLWLKPKRVLG